MTGLEMLANLIEILCTFMIRRQLESESRATTQQTNESHIISKPIFSGDGL